MKPKEINRITLLIAKFDEFPAFEENGHVVWCDHDGQRNCEYHTSFEWIMRVFEKIATVWNNQYLISNGVASIYREGKFLQDFCAHSHHDETIMAAFICVGQWVEEVWPKLKRKKGAVQKHRKVKTLDATADTAGVCYNCLNGFHKGCDDKFCSCRKKKHRSWWWK